MSESVIASTPHWEHFGCFAPANRRRPELSPQQYHNTDRALQMKQDIIEIERELQDDADDECQSRPPNPSDRQDQHH